MIYFIKILKKRIFKRETDILKFIRDFVWILGGSISLIWFVPSGARVFEVQKIFFFRGVVFVLLFLQITIFVWQKTKKIFLESKFQTTIFYFLIFWFLSSIVSVFLSYSPQISFFGEYYRKGGFLEVFTIWIYFFIGIDVFRENFERNKISLIYSLWGIFFLANTYGIFQKIGFDPFPWAENGFDGRVFSFFGQPNFFGDFLAVLLPIFVILIFEIKNLDEKLLIGFSIFLGTINLIFTLSRSAWIGFSISTFIILPIYFFMKKMKKSFFITLATIFFGLISLFVLILSPEIKADNETTKILNRVQNIFQTKAGSGGIRIENWKKIFETAKEKPIFGWGKDTMIIVSRFNFADSSLKFTNDVEYPDRAHNIYLDYFYTEGIFGLFSFFALLSFSTFFSLKKFLETKDKDYIIIFGILISYSVRGFFSFDTQPINLIFWTTISFLVAKTFSFIREEKLKKKNFSKNFIITTISFFVLSFGFFAFTILPIFADINYKNSSSEVDILKEVKMIDESRRMDALEPMYEFFLGKKYATTLNEENLKIAEKFLLSFNKKYGENFYGYNTIGDIYYFLYSKTKSLEYKNLSLQSYNIALDSAIGREKDSVEYKIRKILTT